MTPRAIVLGSGEVTISMLKLVIPDEASVGVVAGGEPVPPRAAIVPTTEDPNGSPEPGADAWANVIVPFGPLYQASNWRVAPPVNPAKVVLLAELKFNAQTPAESLPFTPVLAVPVPPDV